MCLSCKCKSYNEITLNIIKADVYDFACSQLKRNNGLYFHHNKCSQLILPMSGHISSMVKTVGGL